MRFHQRIVLALIPCCAARIATAQAPLHSPHGDGPWAEFGRAVCALPDVDGDGVEDFAVGAPFDRNAAQQYVGSVSVYSGDGGQRLVKVLGQHGYCEFGRSLAVAPDLDGDGRADLLVGAPKYAYSTIQTGGAFVVSTADGAVLRTQIGLSVQEQFGHAVASIGDIDLDGVDDYAVGAPFCDTYGYDDNGTVRVYSGATGVPLGSSTGGQTGAQYGWSISWAGDYDLDGRPDYVVGAPGYSTTYSSIGYARVVSGASHQSLDAFLGAQSHGRFGHAVAGLGDLDGDGDGEIAIAEPEYHGAGNLRGRVTIRRGFLGTQLCSFEGIDGSRTGWSLAPAGDFDGDGLPDLAAGAPGFVASGVGKLGAVRIHTAATGALRTTILGPFVGGDFGAAVAGGFDLNGDSCGELVVGTPSEAAVLPKDGVARLLLGSVMRPYTYCSAKTSSAGCAPRISSTGAPSWTLGDNFHVLAADVLAQKSGVLFWGLAQSSVPFHGGTLCVAQPVVRTVLQASGGTSGCDGTFDFHFSQAYLAASGLAAGTLACAQYWYRDPGFPAPDNMGLSNAVRFEVAP